MSCECNEESARPKMKWHTSGTNPCESSALWTIIHGPRLTTELQNGAFHPLGMANLAG